jgi:hypothetical protein
MDEVLREGTWWAVMAELLAMLGVMWGTILLVIGLVQVTGWARRKFSRRKNLPPVFDTNPESE